MESYNSDSYTHVRVYNNYSYCQYLLTLAVVSIVLLQNGTLSQANRLLESSRSGWELWMPPMLIWISWWTFSITKCLCTKLFRQWYYSALLRVRMRTLKIYPSSARRRAHFTSFRGDGCRARGGCVDQGREQQGYSKSPRSAASYCSSILVDEIGFFCL